MSTLLQNIAKGKRKALIQSFEENKNRVYYIASSIDKSQADKATIWAFKNAWSDIAATERLKETDFTNIVINKLANYLQRTTTKLSKKDIPGKCEELSIEFSMTHASANVPADVDDKINEAIDKIAVASEKDNKTTIIAVCTTVAVVIICILSMAFLAGKDDDNSNVTQIGNEEAIADQTKHNLSGNNSTTSKYEPITSAISATLNKDATYYADIDIKDYGKITVKLDQNSAPTTVANFVGLAESGFYDGLTFHRIIEGFMMQGGDPEGNGTGGSKDKISGEFTANGFDNKLSHTRGAISMARSNDMNSASSQFFIVHQDNQPSLDGKYAAFGYVTEGIEVVDAICESAKPTDGNGTIPASNQPVITSIKIRCVEPEGE